MTNAVKLLLIRTDAKENQLIHLVTDPPLGIMSLSAVVKRNLAGQVDVRLKDLRLKGQGRESLRQELLEWQPDIVGFSALSVEAERTAEWVRFVKDVRPQTTVIVGGPYASATPLECLQNTGADVAFRGEGESSLCKWLSCHMKGESAADVPGLALRDGDGKPFLTGPVIFEDVNSLPMPDWQAIRIDDYYSGYSNNLFTAHPRYAPIMTSRGCPYQCAYCHHNFGQKVRFRDLSLVIDEIHLLHDTYGVREIHITDDIFNVNPKRVLEFCRLLKQSGMRLYISFPNGLRGDLLTPEIIDALKDVGAYELIFAIESASPRIQKLIKKNLNIEKAAEMIRYADSRGIITKSAFMIGFVTETKEEIEHTINFALSLPLLHASFFSVCPYPNTELYEITKKYDPDFTQGENVQFYGYVPSYAQKMGYDLPKIQRWAYVRFYFGSARLLRMLWRFPRRMHFLKCFFIEGLRAFVGIR
ncbi:MAG: radical SAM protein [Candidatus Abyssobacteria bacterium SURF_17]|uniref:Radical SAM protein n=1 Tax=Candidatus Abyssobacteria bacterium SURF_17 TaxID=2093361 RepID=A0A419F7F0_9BACT|nr:MAG: radical SAM protein [Candidatus Abyssubacteria bacterium SURF_17]